MPRNPIPASFAEFQDWAEAMEIDPRARQVTAEEWETKSLGAVLDRSQRLSDVLLIAFLMPPFKHNGFCLEMAMAIGREVKPLMPRIAVSVFEDLIIENGYMNDIPRRERIWKRALKMFENDFNEGPDTPVKATNAQCEAGMAAWTGSFIYCSPNISFEEAAKAVEFAAKAAVSSQAAHEVDPTIHPVLKQFVSKRFDRIIKGAKNLSSIFSPAMFDPKSLSRFTRPQKGPEEKEK